MFPWQGLTVSAGGVGEQTLVTLTLLREENVAQPSQSAIWQVWVPLEQNLPFRRTALTQALKLIHTQTLEH